MSWILRPSARTSPSPNSGSEVGVAFMLAITVLASLDPVASTALR